MLRRLLKVRSMPWRYTRPVTTAAVASVAVLTTALARAVLPREAQPPGALAFGFGALGAYTALRMGDASGVSKHVKHTYIDRLGGDVDDAQTWALGLLGAGCSLVGLEVARRSLVALVPCTRSSLPSRAGSSVVDLASVRAS